MPTVSVTGSDPELAFFLTPRDYIAAHPPTSYGNYLMVVDGVGSPVFWRQTQGPAFDFRPAGDGTYSANAQLDDAVQREALRIDPETGDPLERWLADRPEGWHTLINDPHELWVFADGRTLQSVAGSGTMDLREVGGEDLGGVHHSGLVERDVDGQVTASWTTEGAVDLSLLPVDVLASEALGGDWRYGHVNSVDLLDDGWLVSLRSPGEVIRIARDSGQIAWRLGGPRSDFTFVDDPRSGFFGQHSARWIEPDNVILLDNGTNMGSRSTGDVRVVQYALDLDAGTATMVFEYALDGVGGAEFAGSVQRLDDGRTVVGFGSAGVAVVLDALGTEITRLELPAGMYSYRVWASEL